MEAKDIRTVPITDKMFTRKDLDEAYEAGIKKVVEWGNEECTGHEGYQYFPTMLASLPQSLPLGFLEMRMTPMMLMIKPQNSWLLILSVKGP